MWQHGQQRRVTWRVLFYASSSHRVLSDSFAHWRAAVAFAATRGQFMRAYIIINAKNIPYMFFLFFCLYNFFPGQIVCESPSPIDVQIFLFMALFAVHLTPPGQVIMATPEGEREREREREI